MHEKLATVEYCKHFIHCFLILEWLAHCWIQLTKEESIEYGNNELVPWNSGYPYSSNIGSNMVECHVDCCFEFQERMNREMKFEGNLSVTKQENE
jgi:hypothetical protein